MAEPNWRTNGAEIEAIVSGRHGDPFKLLGLHKLGRDWVARAFVPGAQSLEAMTADGKSAGKLDRLHEAPGIPEEMLPVVPEYLNGRAYTIFGGTSEIQRDIIAKMMLGI